MSKCFPEPKSSGGRVKVKCIIQLCNKSRFQKNETVVDTSKVANKVELANLKSDVDKLVIDKLKNVPINLSSFKRKIDTLDRYWKIKNGST